MDPSSSLVDAAASSPAEHAPLARLRTLSLAHGADERARAARLNDALSALGAAALARALPRDAAALARALCADCPATLLCVGPEAVRAARELDAPIPAVHIVSLEALGAVDHPRPGRREALVVVDSGGGLGAQPTAAAPVLRCAPEELPKAVGRVLAGLRDALRFVPTGRAAFPMRRADFLRYLRASAAPALAAGSLLEALLDQGEALGMPAWQTPQGTVYDRVQTWQWLFERSPTFFEAEQRAHRAARAQAGWVPEAPRPRRDAGPRRALLAAEQRVRVALEVELDVGDLPAGTPVRLFLPCPLETAAQRDVVLVESEPAHLGAPVRRAAGYVYGAPVHVGGDATLRARLVHELTIAERRACGLPRLGTYEHLSTKEQVLSAAKALDDPWRRAGVIYDWMLRVGRFERTADPCVCFECAEQAFVRRRSGHCVLLAHAFVKLCERVGVRARPVRGATFTYARPGGSFGYSGFREPVLGHTWAEVEVPGVGWLPVELAPLVVQGASPHNCIDPGLREVLARDAAHYREAYFGGLDNQHITYSAGVLAVPYAVARVDARAEGERWVPIDQDRQRHRLEITAVGCPPEPG